MRKYILSFAVCFLLALGSKAQSLQPTVIATAGDYFSNSSGSLSWTMGEAVVDYISNSSNSLSQGFQQSYNVITGVQTTLAPSDFSLYVFPNPARELLNIHIENTNGNTYHLYLMDVLGRVQREQTLNGSGILQSEMHLEGLSRGMYFLHVYSAEKELKTIKIEHL